MVSYKDKAAVRKTGLQFFFTQSNYYLQYTPNGYILIRVMKERFPIYYRHPYRFKLNFLFIQIFISILYFLSPCSTSVRYSYGCGSVMGWLLNTSSAH